MVVEFPFYSGLTAFSGAKYMLNSTAHWKPMLNGYSGFQPFSYHRNFEVLERFPDERSVKRLRDQGVTHVFVHVEEYGAPIVSLLDRWPGFRRKAVEDTIVLYTLDAN